MDGDSKNNTSWNLEWVTSRDNNYHAILTGLKKKVKTLDKGTVYGVKLLLAKGCGVADAAKRFGITYGAAREINLGRTYRYVGGDSEFIYPLNGRVVKYHIDAETMGRIVRLCGDGVSYGEVASRFGLSKSTIYSVFNSDRNKACPRIRDGGAASDS